MNLLHLFAIVAGIVVAIWAQWIVRERETIRRYRDHLEAAREETAPEDGDATTEGHS